jgi:hypothetical protein
MIRRASTILLVLIIGIVIGFLSGCSYDGYYRYPCQDPAKIEAPECQSPLCKYNDQCSVDLIGGINEP